MTQHIVCFKKVAFIWSKWLSENVIQFTLFHKFKKRIADKRQKVKYKDTYLDKNTHRYLQICVLILIVEKCQKRNIIFISMFSLVYTHPGIRIFVLLLP